MKKINFKFPKKREQFKIDVVKSLKNNDTITLETYLARPLFEFMRNICVCKLKATSEINISQIIITDPEARFVPACDCVILEVLIPNPNSARLVIEEE